MKLKSVNIIIILLLVVSGISLIFNDNTCKAEGNEIYVNDDFYETRDGSAEHPYDSIQYAIDVANEGDTIYVFGGLYEENLVINKRVKIVGTIEGDPSIIYPKSNSERYGIEINANYVTIESMFIQDIRNRIVSPIGALMCIKSLNVVVQGNHFYDDSIWGIYLHPSSNGNVIAGNVFNSSEIGIYCDNSNTNDIINNKFCNNFENCIKIEDADNNRMHNNTFCTFADYLLEKGLNYSRPSYPYNVDNCVFAKNCKGINITNNNISGFDYYGLYLEDCEKTIIKNNTINHTNSAAIYLKSDNGKIMGNHLLNNRRGVEILGNYNTIMRNKINDSAASGIYAQPTSKGNKIYLNDFYSNLVNAKERGDNNWDNGSAGNYWDDYNWIDVEPKIDNVTGDGIGDIAYTENGVIDNYPLGYFLLPPNRPCQPSPEDGETDESLTITLKVYICDNDSEFVDVYFYREDDSLIGVDESVANDSLATITFTQAFNTTFWWYAVADDGIQRNRSEGIWFFITKTSPPDNDPPIAKFDWYVLGKGRKTRILFNASKSYDPDGKISFYRWNFGDDTSEILAYNPIHNYTNQDGWDVTLTVIDNNGSTATKIVHVDPNEGVIEPLSVLALGPNSGRVGQELSFTGSASGGVTPYTWNWDFDDSTSYGGKKTNHTFRKPGNYLVELRVTDFSGEIKIDTIKVNIKPKSSDDDSPGFEISIIIMAIAILLYIRRKNKK